MVSDITKVAIFKIQLQAMQALFYYQLKTCVPLKVDNNSNTTLFHW